MTSREDVDTYVLQHAHRHSVAFDRLSRHRDDLQNVVLVVFVAIENHRIENHLRRLPSLRSARNRGVDDAEIVQNDAVLALSVEAENVLAHQSSQRSHRDLLILARQQRPFDLLQIVFQL